MSARRYRYIEDEFAPRGRRRVLVVTHRGWDGFVVRYTGDCSGCTEYGDYGTRYGPMGCEECGYTGKRRYEEWAPFDMGAWMAHRDRVWDRYDRMKARAAARATPAGGTEP